MYEVSGGGGFLGKPYEPNSVIKNDVEFILMQRKPGGYRKPDTATRLLSVISAQNYQAWFQQVWTGITGASTKDHPAPYPIELALRLIRMFSFAGDVVLDPFAGSGTTSIAAALTGRNSVGFEINERYQRHALHRLDRETKTLFSRPEIRGLKER
jgi:DNA modification methylase